MKVLMCPKNFSSMTLKKVSPNVMSPLVACDQFALLSDGLVKVDSSTLAIAATIGALVLAALVAFIAVMLVRLKRRKAEQRQHLTLRIAEPVWTTQCPQRFAHPRTSQVRL